MQRWGQTSLRKCYNYYKNITQHSLDKVIFGNYNPYSRINIE